VKYWTLHNGVQAVCLPSYYFVVRNIMFVKRITPGERTLTDILFSSLLVLGFETCNL